MTALLALRDYQQEGLADLEARWEAGAVRVPMVLATGLGKTVMFAHVIARFTASTTAKRALVLVHTDELVQQAAKKIKDVAPHLSVGIVKAEQNQTSARVIVASVQTLRNAKRREQIRNVGLIIVDECHHATATTYRAILEHFGAFVDHTFRSLDGAQRCVAQVGQLETGEMCGRPLSEHKARVAGFTATLARSDKQKLSDVWQDCTFVRGISFGIRRGYLLDVRGVRVIVPDLDLSRVRKSGGDFQDGALEEELDRSLAPARVADAYVTHASERKAIGFAPTVASAEHFAAEFSARGIPTAVVHGKLGQLERRLILKRLASGDIRVVWNCAVLTEGFDDPTISCIIMARPTQSAPLYQQCIGRGLRPDLSLPPAERGDCLVLDVVGASRNHSLRSLIDLSEREIREEIAQDGDLSLIEMEDQERELQEREPETTAEEWYEGETKSIDFDPLGRTTIGAWLRSDEGTYFLPCGREAYVLIVPGEEPGTHDVAWLTVSPRMFRHSECLGMGIYFTDSRVCSCGQRHSGAPGGVTEHTGVSLEMAVSWGEEVMEEMGGTMLGSTKKRWRREPPSEAQQRKARMEGIVVPTDENGEVAVSKGELSDMINERVGSRRIDPVVTFMMKLREGEK